VIGTKDGNIPPEEDHHFCTGSLSDRPHPLHPPCSFRWDSRLRRDPGQALPDKDRLTSRLYLWLTQPHPHWHSVFIERDKRDLEEFFDAGENIKNPPGSLKPDGTRKQVSSSPLRSSQIKGLASMMRTLPETIEVTIRSRYGTSTPQILGDIVAIVGVDFAIAVNVCRIEVINHPVVAIHHIIVEKKLV
jgi:hypothetical protein